MNRERKITSAPCSDFGFFMKRLNRKRFKRYFAAFSAACAAAKRAIGTRYGLQLT